MYCFFWVFFCCFALKLGFYIWGWDGILGVLVPLLVFSWYLGMGTFGVLFLDGFWVIKVSKWNRLFPL